MSPDATEPRRRLIVVVFADIAGYTELTARDEEASLAVVALLRRLSAEAVEVAGGRVVKHLGDGVMAAFESVDDALGGAFFLQARFASHQTAQAAGVKLRVGVHLGEVIEAEDGDLYGDGVNTASRVQSLARPGDVAISDTVYRQIRNRSAFTTLSLGTHEVKGLAEPLDVWAVAPEGTPIAPYAPPKPTRAPSSSRAAAIGIGAAVVTFVGLGIAIASSAGPGGDGADESALDPGLDSTTAVEAAATPVEGEVETEPAAADPVTPVDPQASEATDPTPSDPSPTTEAPAPATPAEGREAGPPDEPTVRELGPGGWVVSEGLDAASGSAAITVAREARSGGALFGVRCLLETQQVNAAIVWPRDVSPDRFQYAIDRTPGTAPWVRGPDANTSIFAGDLSVFLRDVIRGRTLNARAPDTSGTQMNAAFDLVGAVRALGEIRRVCNLR